MTCSTAGSSARHRTLLPAHTSPSRYGSACGHRTTAKGYFTPYGSLPQARITVLLY